ncbi:hypothetical protein OHA25_10145 [Nonomuraea sp. NBC_00507]|uniref:hypothetical protein n=1 Tax=Nonomuraea sp. NBC_00507 TaxID=2976002 RepID=UPI002E19799E
MSNIENVINRALQDTAFAEELRDKSMAVAKEGFTGAAWQELIRHFAQSPAALAQMSPTASEEELGTTSLTVTTTTTTTTVACTITTTSTTTTTTTAPMMQPEITE